MADDDLRRGVRKLIADAAVMIERGDRKEAVGYIVVCIDKETHEPVYSTGLFEDPESALLESGEQDRDSRKNWEDKGEVGYTHHVVAVFKPQERGT